jgi:hypothetical protein
MSMQRLVAQLQAPIFQSLRKVQVGIAATQGEVNCKLLQIFPRAIKEASTWKWH